MACRCVNHITKKCLNCGKGFSLCRYRRKEAKYCSSSCRTRTLIREGKLPQAIFRSREFGCLVCGKMVRANGKRKEIAKYCGYKCMGIAMRGREPANKDKRELVCGVCKGKFLVPPSRIDQKYCSDSCKGKAMIGKPAPMKDRKNYKLTGEGHWNWKGGITPMKLKLRMEFRRTIQRQVLERDGFTCQLCGISGEYLHVDHIQPWADYLEGRFSIDNCRTLCRRCHYKITYGREMPKDSNWGRRMKYLGA